MTSATGRSSRSASVRIRRVRSRSVNRPTGAPSSTTTTEPMSWASIRATASRTGSAATTVTTSAVITPWTVSRSSVTASPLLSVPVLSVRGAQCPWGDWLRSRWYSSIRSAPSTALPIVQHPGCAGTGQVSESARSCARGGPMRIFYVTDLHGSEICWKKFLNAGAFYKADVVIVGGDVTGKAMVPDRAARERRLGPPPCRTSARSSRPRPRSSTSRRVMNRGYYPIRVSDEEYVAMQEDEDHGRQAVQAGHARRHLAVDRHGGGQAGRPGASASSCARPTTTCSRSTTSCTSAQRRGDRR